METLENKALIRIYRKDLTPPDEGIIIKKDDTRMLQVNIDILGRSVDIEICGDYLEIA